MRRVLLDQEGVDGSVVVAGRWLVHGWHRHVVVGCRFPLEDSAALRNFTPSAIILVGPVGILVVAVILHRQRLLRIKTCRLLEDAGLVARRRAEVLLKLECDGSLEVFLVDQVHVTLHQRPDGLIHGFLTHLERVANFDLLDVGKWILLGDWLVGIQSWCLVIVLRLLEALVAPSGLIIGLIFILVPLQVYFGAFERDKLLLDQIGHLFLDQGASKLPRLSHLRLALLPQVLVSDPKFATLFDDFGCVGPHSGLFCAEVE